MRRMRTSASCRAMCGREAWRDHCRQVLRSLVVSSSRFAAGFSHAPVDNKMRGTSLWPKQSPVLTPCPRGKQAKHKILTETDSRAPELVGVHTLDGEGRFILREPAFQPSVLEVGQLFIIPILVERRIVLH